MKPPTRQHVDREQLIGALVPTAIIRDPRPSPAPMPALPPLCLPTGPEALLLGMARLDPSGRLSARDLLKALNWGSGHRLDIDVVNGILVIRPLATARHVVGGRGELSLPMAARQMCAIAPGSPVVLVASVPHDTLVIHPASTVTRLLNEFHAQLMRGHDAR